jgi:hypothetical protein
MFVAQGFKQLNICSTGLQATMLPRDSSQSTFQVVRFISFHGSTYLEQGSAWGDISFSEIVCFYNFWTRARKIISRKNVLILPPPSQNLKYGDLVSGHRLMTPKFHITVWWCTLTAKANILHTFPVHTSHFQLNTHVLKLKQKQKLSTTNKLIPTPNS